MIYLLFQLVNDDTSCGQGTTTHPDQEELTEDNDNDNEEAVLAPAFGDEIVLRLSDLGEDESIGGWVSQGYSVLGCTESGDYFLQFTGGELSGAKSPEDDSEQLQVCPPSVFVELEASDDEDDEDPDLVLKGSSSAIPLSKCHPTD